MSANVFDPEFDDPTDKEGFSYRRARIGWHAGGERLGASLFEVAPGGRPRPGSKFFSFREGDAVDYLDGEPHPSDTAPR